MKPVPQKPGQLPDGATLDTLLTPEQFAVWRNQPIATLRKKLATLPGVIAESRKFIRVHPRTFLAKSVAASLMFFVSFFSAVGDDNRLIRGASNGFAPASDHFTQGIVRGTTLAHNQMQRGSTPRPATNSPTTGLVATRESRQSFTAADDSSIEVRWSALSMQETGDDDSARGPDGEVSRYAILESLWNVNANQGDAWTNRWQALRVAMKIQSSRVVSFAKNQGRMPTDLEWALLWKCPARLSNPTPEKLAQARCVVNLMRKLRTTQDAKP